MPEVREMTAGAEFENERADVAAAKVASVTRTAAQRLLENGCVTVNGVTVKKNCRITAGDVISVTLPEPEPSLIEAQDIDIDIVYEDDCLAVVNKPRGMVVHPAAGNRDKTMVNALMYKLSSLSSVGGEIRPGIVHRIDKNTSGLLIVAKTDDAHNALAAQIKAHSFTRVYNAVVRGNIADGTGTVDAPIGRSEKNRQKMAVTYKNSKNAVTHYRVLERFHGYTLLELKLETGRTHQIRVHMASLGHPVLGDDVYGGTDPRFPELCGQCLHAKEIGFIHPRTGEYMHFGSELPDYFRQTLEKLGGDSARA